MTIHRMDLDGVGSPAALADRIHAVLPDLTNKFDLEALCRQLDIVSIAEAVTTSFEAALVTDELKSQGSILLASGSRAERARFSIGHELGHFLIPTHLPASGRPFSCSLDDLHSHDVKDRDRRRRIEAEANRFAARLLMPPNRARALMASGNPGLPRLVEVAREFGVSKEAMARQWTTVSREPVAFVIARNGLVDRFYRHQDFPWLPLVRGKALPHYALVSRSQPSPGEFTGQEEVDADTWLSERDSERVLALTEEVLGQAEGYVMIMLQAELDED